MKWLSALSALLVIGAAVAQNYPTHAVKIVVPFPPGGGADTLARPIAERLRQRLGQPFIVENRSGAASNIGTELVARSTPDGYTLLLNTDGVAIYPHLYSSLSYDVFRDLTPITFVAETPMVLGANPSVPASNVKELVALAKKEPGRLNFANPGLGTPHHLAFELFTRQADIKVTHINYRGGGPALQDVLAGHVQLGMFTLGAVLPQIKAGNLKAFAVVTARRSEVAPNLPTMAEAGLPGVQASLRFVLMAPAGTPKEAIAKLQTAVAMIVKEAEVREALNRQGFDPLGTTAEETAATLRQDYDRWGPILKAANIKLD